MAEISVHRRERPSGNVPVALSWADRLFNELMPSRVFLELMPSMMKDRGELMPEERQFGSFTRSFMLPSDVKEDRVSNKERGVSPLLSYALRSRRGRRNQESVQQGSNFIPKGSR